MTKIAIKRPVTKVAVKGPGIVKGVRVASGPAGPAGAAGADGVIQFVNGKTGASVTLDAGDVGAQPSDSDLAAIAALTTTAYGRALLTLANQAALVALLPSYQPLDSDLTSIAALSTTTYGRSLLTLANQAALVALLPSYQPLDADLTAIAALTTTAFGRAFLALADAAATRAAIEAAGSTGGGREKSAALSATTGTATGDLNAASIFTVVPTGNITLAFSNVPASGTACSLRVRVAQGATPRSVTMPSGIVHWFTAEPTQTANKVTVYEMETLDSGTNWDVWAAVEK